MKLLDLFCGAGGAAMGYYRAGFENITGVDIEPQPNYPFKFVQADALEYLAEHGREYDVSHASPPCQAYVDHNKNKKSKHPRLIKPTRKALKETEKYYIIENVRHAPLLSDLMLCGTMFGLRVFRHRYFENNFSLAMSPFSCNHWGQVADGEFIGVYAFGGHGHRKGPGVRDPKPAPPKVTPSEAMGIDWMTNYELTQAIPPAYTKFIGEHLMKELR